MAKAGRTLSCRSRGKRGKVLKDLKIPRSSYYAWRKAYEEEGVEGLTKAKTSATRVWNRLTGREESVVLKIAHQHPELSPRLLALKITDEEAFSVSESTVYRILREHALIASGSLLELPAEKQWRHKTNHPDELWQCDGTNLFIVGWGYYKLIPVQDDYSRKIIAYDLRPDETAFSISDMEMGIENARKEGHHTDNGSGVASKVLAGYLDGHGIKHIFGTPYHPQGRGKIERFNRRIKERICLVVYSSPEVLKQEIDEAIALYNDTPHESLSNVSPDDVYAGRKEAILQQRQEKKRLTMQRRRQSNLYGQRVNNDSSDWHHSANSFSENVSKKG